MTRKQARDTAFKLLYQMQMQKETPQAILDIHYGENDCTAEAKAYIDDVVAGVFGNLDQIDLCIKGLLEGWRLERISQISLAAIRLSVYEITHREDIPNGVSVNEAVSLAKKYEGEQAASFVNGVLATLLKKGKE